MKKEYQKQYELVVDRFQRKTGSEMFTASFANRSGWAILVLDEDTGFVSIQSDYGNWDFIWPPACHGRRSLKHFLCEADYPYLAGKFFHGRGEEEFDFHGTVDKIKRDIIDARRGGEVGNENAREVYDEVDEMEECGEDTFYANMSRDLSIVLGDEPWHSFVHRKKPEYLWLVHGILPALIGELRKFIPVPVK